MAHFFFIFHALSFELNFVFDRSFPLSTILFSYSWFNLNLKVQPHLYYLLIVNFKA